MTSSSLVPSIEQQSFNCTEAKQVVINKTKQKFFIYTKISKHSASLVLTVVWIGVRAELLLLLLHLVHLLICL